MYQTTPTEIVLYNSVEAKNHPNVLETRAMFCNILRPYVLAEHKVSNHYEKCSSIKNGTTLATSIKKRILFSVFVGGFYGKFALNCVRIYGKRLVKFACQSYRSYQEACSFPGKLARKIERRTVTET